MAIKGQVPKPVTLSECVAFVVTFRRLLVVCGILPLMCAISPFVVGVYLAIMNFVFKGFGFSSTLLALFFYMIGRLSIIQYAPSLEKRSDALAKSRVSLPLAGFVVGRILISYILYPLSMWLGLEEMLLYSPKMPYVTALRLSACMLLLGLVILARFVGPISVVRCSETLLQCHPFSVSIITFWKRCTSLDAFLGLVAAPSDKHGQLLAPLWQESGLRYQRPSLRASVGQILFSTVIGLLLPFIITPTDKFNPTMSMVLTATSVLTLLAHLLVSALDGTSHELDPKRYQSNDLQAMVSFQQVPSLFSTFGSAVVVVPAVAVSIVSRYNEEHDDDDASSTSIIALTLLALVTTTLMSIYLILVNQASKVALCMPGLNIATLVKEFSNDATTYSRDEVVVMLQSILQGNEFLVGSVLEPMQKAGVLYVEDQELERANRNKTSMARSLLFMDRLHVESVDGRLERDVLCMLLLETLGGGGDGVNLSIRHEVVVKKWAHSQNAMFVGAARREPHAVPLLRALCCYAAGLGEALELVSLPPNAPQRLALNIGSFTNNTSWVFPPGARACAEWLIRGAARLIVYSLTCKEGPASDWRSSSLSILIPVMLQAAFSLRVGVLRFARVNQDRATVVTTAMDVEWLSGSNKVLRPIVLACEEAAISVVKTLQSMDGATQMNMPMSSECRIWLETLVGTATAR